MRGAWPAALVWGLLAWLGFWYLRSPPCTLRLVNGTFVEYVVVGLWVGLGLTNFRRPLPGPPTQRQAVIPRWLAWGGLFGIGAVALGFRALEFLREPAHIIQSFGYQCDEQVFLTSALVIARLDWITLLKPSFDFPLLNNAYGFLCPVGLALVLGTCIKLWGFFSGLHLWMWSLIVGGSLLCLVPYAWQRLWGYPGVGGLVAGILLATSPGLRTLIVQMVSDNQSYLWLGGALVILARLATRERWRDVVILGGLLGGLSITRFLLLPIGLALIGTLTLIWWMTATSSVQRRVRLAKLATVFGIAVALIWLAEYLFLQGYGRNVGHGHPYFLSQIPGVAGPVDATVHVETIGALLFKFWNDLTREHLLWLLALPVAGVIGVRCCADARRTSHWQPWLLLSAATVAYAVEAVLRNIYMTRYIYPTMLLEAILLAWMIDLLWLQLHGRSAFKILCVVTLIVVGVLPTQPLLESWGAWRRITTQQARYLAWVKPQLPTNAVILVSDTVDPWEVARRLGRPTRWPVNMVGSLRLQALSIQPHAPAREEYQPIRYAPDMLSAIPGLSLTPHARFSRDALLKRTDPFVILMFDDLIQRGMTPVVLGPPADPSLVDQFKQAEREGRLDCGDLGRYRLQASGDPPAAPKDPWVWYALVATS